jgi:hypothetical protein
MKFTFIHSIDVIRFVKEIINVMRFNFGINFIHVIKIHPFDSFEHPYNYVYVNKPH